MSLRAALVFAHAHAGLVGLDVMADVFKTVTALPPKLAVPARSATCHLYFHLCFLAVAGATPVIREYAACFVVCMLAALRVRDAQRATLSDAGSSGVVLGRCYTSKHPKRRQAAPMDFARRAVAGSCKHEP